MNVFSIVLESDVMIVIWSNVYSVEIYLFFIFFCIGYIILVYLYLECIGKNDKICLYKLMRKSGLIVVFY